MACGVPVITTEIGTGTSYYNLHKKTGLVIPPFTALAIAKAVETALRDAKNEKWGLFARERVLDYFSYWSFFYNWENLFDVLQKQRP
jgi:glycosyltransferase involved in cell wall biosynthesis